MFNGKQVCWPKWQIMQFLSNKNVNVVTMTFLKDTHTHTHKDSLACIIEYILMAVSHIKHKLHEIH